MKILTMTKDAAMERSHQEAISRGCSGNTLYWWGFCDDGLLIFDDKSGLTDDEKAALTDYIPPETMN